MRQRKHGCIAAALTLLVGCSGGQSVGGTTSVVQTQLAAAVSAVNAYCNVATAKHDIEIQQICDSAQQYAPITLAAANAVLDTIEALFKQKVADRARSEAECR